MTRVLNWLTVILFVASVVLQNPLLFLVAVLLALVAGVTALWGRYALAGVTYTRRLGTTRMFVGEETDLWLEVANAKPLPLAWLKVNDEFPAEMALVKGRLLRTHKESRRQLVNLLSLRFYERVRKRYHLRAQHRGALEFGPAELTSGDMFGLKTQQRLVQEIDLLIVYPKVVPITALGLPAAHPFGGAKTTRRIAEDPLRMMGVRAYAPGDSPRRIHWKATARRGTLQTKVFDPSAARVSAIFLDMNTVPIGYWGYVPEYLEFGISAAASVARFLLDAREAVGLYVNGSRRNEWNLVRLPPSRRPARWFEILDTLAWLIDLPSTRLEDYLRAEMPALSFGATVVVISAAVTDALAAAMLDLKTAGHPVALLAIGETAPTNVPEDLNTFWLGGRETYERLTQLELG
jgi:uncharacterized protein (DUF58 family)